MSRRFMLPGNILTASLALGIFTLILMAACSDDDPVAPEQAAPREISGTIGAAGGTLESDDGELKLVVPAGALDADTEITITEVGPDDVPTLSRGFDVLNAYEMTPDGLNLNVPATLILNVNLPVAAKRSERDHVFPVMLSSVVPSDQVQEDRIQREMTSKALLGSRTAEATMSIDWVRATMVIGVPEGGGPSVLYSGFSTYFGTEGSPREGEDFVGLIQVVTSRGFDITSDVRYRDQENPAFTFPWEHDQVIPPNSEGAIDEGEYSRNWRVDIGAKIEGDHLLGFGMSFEGQYVYEVIFNGEVEPPAIEGTTKVEYELEEIVVTTLPASAGDFLPRGLYSGEIDGEGIRIVRIPGFKYDHTAIFSGGDGSVMRSLDIDTPLEDRLNRFGYPGVHIYGSALAGGITLKNDVPTGLTFIHFGPNGMLMSPWLPEEDDFGFSQGGFLNMNITDGQAYGGMVDTGGFVVVNNTLGSAVLFEYEAANESFSQVGAISSFPGASGSAVTAAVRPGGNALIVTDGTPGQIFTHDRGDLFAPAVLLGTAGDSPRRVRTAGGLAVISNFASDNLTVLTWSETDVVTIVTTVPVGDGPVGIDLQVQNGGNVAVASTGFNDNTYSVTVLSPAGAVVSNSQTVLQAGAEGPGHVVWLGDPDNSLIISCKTTGNVAVVDSGLN